MRTRRPKRNVELPEDASSSDEQQILPERKKASKQHSSRARILDGYNEGVEISDVEIEKRLDFCCFQCTCSEARRGRIPSNDQYVHSSDDSLWHRRCCHNLVDLPPEEWLSPADQAILDAVPTEENYHLLGQESTDVQEFELEDLRKKYWTAKRHESEMYNEDEIEDPGSQLDSNTHYHENRKLFHEELARVAKRDRKSACVLDMFAGIGSSLVSLKRLGIKIHKVIHVEHDKIATLVYKTNHDSNYNPELVPDGIEHVYFSTFEEVEGNLRSIILEHGPIDIVPGGPPCVDYSEVNAWRQGTEGEQGKYMLRFGKVVRKIKKQYRELTSLPKKYPVFFMAENTALRNSRHVPLAEGDLEKIKAAFGIHWELTFDSKDVSPCRRKRTYLSNIPFALLSTDYCDSPATSCTKGDYNLAASIVDDEMVAKANCFMASYSRTDDPRMLIYKQDGNTVLGRTISIEERELMMGFPQGYVSKPVNQLFSSLFADALGKQIYAEQTYWKHVLNEKYQIFSGNYHNLKEGEQPFKYEVYVGEPPRLRLAPPQTTQAPQFYNADQYAKRLVGNAFSIPAVDIILRPLQGMFASKRYEGYAYAFEWKDSGPNINDDESRVSDDDEGQLFPAPLAVASKPNHPQPGEDEQHDEENQKPSANVCGPRKEVRLKREDNDEKPAERDDGVDEEKESHTARVPMKSQKNRKSNHPQPDEDEQDDEENQKPSANLCIPRKEVRLKREDNDQKAAARDDGIDEEKESPTARVPMKSEKNPPALSQPGEDEQDDDENQKPSANLFIPRKEVRLKREDNDQKPAAPRDDGVDEEKEPPTARVPIKSEKNPPALSGREISDADQEPMMAEEWDV